MVEGIEIFCWYLEEVALKRVDLRSWINTKEQRTPKQSKSNVLGIFFLIWAIPRQIDRRMVLILLF